LTVEKIGWYKLQAFVVVLNRFSVGNGILFAAHTGSMGCGCNGVARNG